MLLVSLMVTAGSTFAQITLQGNRPVFEADGKIVVMAPEEGLWSVAAGWQDDWTVPLQSNLSKSAPCRHHE